MRKIYILLSLLLLLGNIVKAQERTITGTVLDEKNDPLPGVTVQVKGSQGGTITDASGKYSLKATNLQSITVGVTFIGYNYQAKTLRIGEMNADFKMALTNSNLDEVVVVGYGEQKKSSLTGSVSTIDVKKIQDIPSLNLAASLVGQVPGLSIGQNPRPGQPATITIRNPITFNSTHGGSTDPIYIIDDVVRSAADFNLLDANEVESISVLKDAEAAIYGISSGNGAILVRTKKGKAGTPKISFSSSFGTANAVQLPKMLSGIQFAQWSNDYTQMSVMAPNGVQLGNTIDANGYINGVATNKNSAWYTPDELAYIANPANNTNYLAEEFKAANVEREALNISGGSDKVNYFIGGDYVKQGSNFAGINTNKWGLRANVEAKPAKGLTVDLNLNTEQFYTKSYWYKMSGTSENLNNDVTALAQMPPFLKYYVNGNPVLINNSFNGATDLDNIDVSLFQNSDNFTSAKNYITNILGKISYDIPGVDGLTAAVTYNDNISTSFPTQYGTYFNYYKYSGLGDNSHIPGGTLQLIQPIKNGDAITYNPSYNTAYQLDASLNYKHSFKKNNISALVIYEQRETYLDGITTNGAGVIVGGLPNFAFTTGVTSANQANSQVAETGKLSYIARLNYDYDGKYLVQFLGRRDGTTDFAPGYQYGNTGAVSVGWIATRENFVKNALPFVDFLKIRGSFGLLGSDNTSATAYQYYQQYNVKTGSSGGAVFNEGLRGNGLAPTSIPNPNTTWDHVLKTDVGIDMEFLKNRLAITGDYYFSHVYDGLTTLSGSVPFTVGNTTPTENFAIANLFGYELSATWKDHISENWNYNITGFFSWSDDKLIRTDFSQGLIGTFEDPTGKSDDRGVLGLKSLGMIRTQAQADAIIASRANAAGGAQNVKILGYTPGPGMINYVDKNGDGIINSDITDQMYLSHKSNNHKNVGFNFGASYKSLSLNVVTGLSWGGQGTIPGTEITANQKSDLYENRAAFWSDHWTPQTPNAKYPAPYYINDYNVTSDFWFVNSFTWNIQNANLSYTLPNKWVKVIGLANARLYAECTNVLNLYNPYPGHYKAVGGSFGDYPPLRTISLGLNAGF